MSFIIKR